MDMRFLRKQKGQAVPLGMALFLFLGITAFVLFNTGQTASDKSRLVNAADSAVYSGLLWQSRAMNFTAYTNRAMVANQVAMAQAVSINSWSGYLSKSGYNVNAAFGWIPYVGTVTNVVYQISRYMDMVLDPITQGMLTVVNMVNTGLSYAQQGMYLVSFVATPDVVNTVVKANEPTDQSYKWETAFSIGSAGLNMYKWSKLTENFDKDHRLGMNERFHIVNASIDKFSQERDWKFFKRFMPIHPLLWFRFEKAGTTKLTRDASGKTEWYAKDAFSLRFKRYTWRGKKYHDAPIGGGATNAKEDGYSPTYDREHSWGRRTGYPQPEYFGGRHKVAQFKHPQNIFNTGRELSGYSGLQAYRSLSEAWRNDPEPPTLKLRVEVTIDPDEVNDSHNAEDINSNRFAANVGAPGGFISTVATGELFFERPCFEQGCETEFANGYSPYWDVRLAQTTGAARLVAYTSHVITGENPFDGSNVQESNMNRLPRYDEKLATPLSDYKAQLKGVRVAIRGMENHLETLLDGSAAHAEYQARLTQIQNNFNADLQGIAASFVAEEIVTEEDIIGALARAAGVDLDTAEFGVIQDEMKKILPEIEGINFGDFTSLDAVKDAIRGKVTELTDNIVQQVKDRLEDEIKKILKDAIKNIMKGLVEGYLSGYGIDLENTNLDEIVDGVADGAAGEIVDTVTAPIPDDDDIVFDHTDACSVEDSVINAEGEGADYEARIEAVNGEIVAEFQLELEASTAFAISEQGRLNGEIGAIREEIRLERETPTMNSDEFAIWHQGKLDEIEILQGDLDDVPEDRVHRLATALVEISNRRISAEFGANSDYLLDYRHAREAVVDMLGDIENLEVDPNGDPITDGLIFGIEEENETASDAEQGETQQSAACQ